MGAGGSVETRAHRRRDVGPGVPFNQHDAWQERIAARAERAKGITLGPHKVKGKPSTWCNNMLPTRVVDLSVGSKGKTTGKCEMCSAETRLDEDRHGDDQWTVFRA